MAYTINLTDGNVFATVNDGTVNTASSVTLVGKNYAGYGEFLDENFIQMLENFAKTTAPAAPLTGQLWFNKTNNLMNVYNGTAFKTLSITTASASAPASNVQGDLWYDTTLQQLNVYTGASFLVVGPAYTSASGTAGAVPETITDSGATPQFVTTIYANGVRVAVYSNNATFTASGAAATLFPTVYKGVTMSNATGTNMSGNLIGGGNVTVTTNSSTVIATFTGTGANIAGYGNITGNITGGNILTAGQVSATGNITGGNVLGGANVNATLFTGTTISVSGNITGGNVLGGANVNATTHTGTTVSVTGNITGGNVLGGANVNATTHTGTTVSVSGNITGGNILTAGVISATGNVSGNFFLGNGSQLTGVAAAASAAQIELGTSNIKFAGSGNAATINIGGTSNVVVIDTTTLFANVANVQSIVKSSANATGNVGSTTNYFNQIFVDRVNATTVSASGNITGGNVLGGANVNATLFTGTTVSVTGNITGGNVLGGANVNATLFTGTTVSVTGNITGGNLITSGTTGVLSVNSITHTGTNAIGNIGSSSSYFNQVFATATTALYADVAERFWADEILEPGTVVELGGVAEITRSVTELSENVFGVISTRAAYLMNGGAGENDTHPPVAMTGRVPVKVVGTVRKGDRLVSAGAGIARAAQAGEVTAFNVIGRSLVDKPTPESGTIEAIVTIKN
jgi:hypothetical protein